MNKTAEKYYNRIAYHLKNKINLPHLYQDLNADQQRFFDEILNNDSIKDIEILKQSYTKIISHIDGFVESLEKVDSILYPLE